MEPILVIAVFLLVVAALLLGVSFTQKDEPMMRLYHAGALVACALAIVAVLAGMIIEAAK